MEQNKINRINELSKKSRTNERLTPEEIVEREALRREYIDDMKRNLRAQLENIDVEYPDGKTVSLKKK